MDRQPSDNHPPKTPKKIPGRVRKILEKIESDGSRLHDECWTSSLIPGESHRDLLREIVTNGIPDLAAMAEIELEALIQSGGSLSDLIPYTAKVMEEIERRIDLESRIQKATVDPLGRASDGIAMIVAAIKALNPGAAAVMASQMEEWIRTGNAEAINEIAKLTRCDASNGHRVHRMLKLVIEFHNEHHRFPSRAEARRTVADREIAEARDPALDRWAHQFPDQMDTKEWKRLWEQCGLKWLDRGKPGRPPKK